MKCIITGEEAESKSSFAVMRNSTLYSLNFFTFWFSVFVALLFTLFDPQELSEHANPTTLNETITPDTIFFEWQRHIRVNVFTVT